MANNKFMNLVGTATDLEGTRSTGAQRIWKKKKKGLDRWPSRFCLPRIDLRLYAPQAYLPLQTGTTRNTEKLLIIYNETDFIFVRKSANNE